MLRIKTEPLVKLEDVVKPSFHVERVEGKWVAKLVDEETVQVSYDRGVLQTLRNDLSLLADRHYHFLIRLCLLCMLLSVAHPEHLLQLSRAKYFRLLVAKSPKSFQIRLLLL